MKTLETTRVKNLLSAIGVANLEHAVKLANLHAELISLEWAYSPAAQRLIEAVEAAKTQAERMQFIIARPQAEAKKGEKNG